MTDRRDTVLRIKKVNNPLLKAAYEIKKQEMQRKYCKSPSEKLYFHGTNKSNVNSICTYGFDWRKSGSNYGHKFGKGLSFATKSGYASHYGDLNDTQRCMLVVRILECSTTVGNKFMIYPPEGFDTTIKPNGDVIVKYDDYECYPEFVIYYESVHIQPVCDEYDDYDY